MEFLNDVEKDFSMAYIVMLHNIFETTGMNSNLYTFSSHKSRYTKQKTFRFQCTILEGEYFDFWEEPPVVDKQQTYLYEFFPKYSTAIEPGGVPFSKIIDLVTGWLSTRRNEIEIERKFREITNKTIYDEKIGIILENKNFNKNEFDALHKKLDSLSNLIVEKFKVHKDIHFEVAENNLEAIEDLKQALTSIKTYAENPEHTKEDTEKISSGTMLNVARKYAGNKAVEYVAKHTLQELLSIFAHSGGNLSLGEFAQNLIGG